MFRKIIVTSLIFILTFSFIGCNTEKEILIAKNNKIIEETLEIKEMQEQVENKKETIGIVGDYAATLEVVENFNTNCYITNHLMKGFIDDDGGLVSVSLEEKITITNATELNDYVDKLEKEYEEKGMRETLNIYDETFFEKNNLHIIVSTTSCPSYKLIKTEKLSTIEENKYDYILKYENDMNMTINGFKTCFFVIEVDKTISDEINEIKIETIS